MDRNQVIRAVTGIILECAKPNRIYVYGSEASGEAEATSDIDIAFDDDHFSDMKVIEAQIQEIPTLLLVDVKNLAFCDPRFVNRVKGTGRVLYSANKRLRFEDGLYNYSKALEKLKIVVQDRERFIKDGYGDVYLDLAVKRFEFTFEMCWKVIKRYLDFVGLKCQNPRSCFKEAFTQGLLEGEETWLDMIEMRNLSSHIYSEEEIRQILEKLEGYCQAFTKLHEKLIQVKGGEGS